MLLMTNLWNQVAVFVHIDPSDLLPDVFVTQFWVALKYCTCGLLCTPGWQYINAAFTQPESNIMFCCRNFTASLICTVAGITNFEASESIPNTLH